MKASLPCAVCSTSIESIDEESLDQPYGANIFISYGHYGATAYDAPGGEHLEIFICTDCLETMQKNRVVHRVLHATRDVEVQRYFWNSENDPHTDNPKNELRLNNEFAMERYIESQPDMNEEWAHRVYEACRNSSENGEVFDPSDIHPS